MCAPRYSSAGWSAHAVRLLVTTVVFLLAVTHVAVGHPLAFSDTTVVLRADGAFQADLIVDLDALALGAPQSTDDAELVAALTALTPDEFAGQLAGLRRLFQRRVRFRFDGAPAPFEVTFPDYGAAAATESVIPTLLGLTARLTGTVPPGATALEFFASRAFSDVNLTIRDEARDLTIQALVEAGARSDPFTLAGPVEPRDTWSIGATYLRLGFLHIVPLGLDHVLFVLGLFLLGAELRPLVWQVSVFTVAHATTLSLAVFNIASMPPALVEPLIALSIVYVGVENLLTRRLTAWRQMIVFGFGLLHGLGFAGVLQELGLPDQERVLGLISFNVGIELGQLLVIGTALVAVGWCRSRDWYRRRIVMPGSVAIAAAGLFWAVERWLGA